jgi:PAS domain S-box-containing protein
MIVQTTEPEVQANKPQHLHSDVSSARFPRSSGTSRVRHHEDRVTMRQQAKKYGLGILAAVVALELRELLNPLLGSENPYHTAWAAVAFAAWYCGIGPAIVTVAIDLIGVWYWFLPAYSSFRIENKREIYGMIGFLLFSALVIWLGETTRSNTRKRERAELELRKAHDELEDRVRQRTHALEQSAASLEQKTGELVEQATMLDLANDAIFVRNANDVISYWNEGAERLYGWKKEEAIGKSPYDLLRTQFPSPLERIKASESWSGELRHRKRDGSEILVASRWRTLRDSSGQPTGWLEINTDITFRRQAEEAARSLSGRLLALQDAERRRIARGLHDSLGQYLAALKMNLDAFPSPDETQAKMASECAQIVDKCLTETRTISHLLHPPLLDESGLRSAARWFVDEFSRRSGIAVDFEVSPEMGRLPSQIEIAMFRAIQEGLTNVHRHSGASSVRIRLGLQENQIRLEIHDNGKGIPQDQLHRLVEGATQSGVGLAGMRERLRELNGKIEIRSDETGTTLVVTAPRPIKSANLAPVAV